MQTDSQTTGRCYCGQISFQTSEMPTAVSYCHCTDCRRVSGAPVAAFAAFDKDSIVFSPDSGKEIKISSGVARTFCENCGSPISGIYDYLPGSIYISLGLIDQADNLSPTIHAHYDNKLIWLNIVDDCMLEIGSARDQLNK